MARLRKDYTGQTIVNRTVIGISHWNESGDPMWSVVCIPCGNTFTSLSQDLKRAHCRGCKYHAHRKRPFESLYNAFIGKNDGRHHVELSYEEFVALTATSSCHYCEDEIVWSEYQTKGNGTSLNAYHLDRKDNDIGYTNDNVVVCCSRCNLSRGNRFTYEEWKQIGSVIRKWREDAEANSDGASSRAA